MVAPAEKASLLGSKFDRNSVVSGLSLLCLVSISLGDFFGGFLNFCPPASASRS